MKKSIALLFAVSLLPFASAAPKKPDAPKDTPAKEEKATPGKKPADSENSDEAVLASAKRKVDLLSPTQKAQLLELLNKGDSKALEAITGIGAKRAATIIAKRPYGAIEDLALVDDIGEKTFTNVIVFGKGEQPAPVKKEKPATAEEKEPAKKMK